MGISIREYARLRGITDAAVHKAIKQGRIKKEDDGSIDPKKADKAWVNNTARPQLKTVTTPSKGNGQSTLTSGNTYIEAKTTNEIIKAQTNKLRFKQLSGELIDKEKACQQVFQLARQQRDAWQAWPARIANEMAAQLNIDAHTLQITLEQYIYDHLLELSQTKLELNV